MNDILDFFLEADDEDKKEEDKKTDDDKDTKEKDDKDSKSEKEEAKEKEKEAEEEAEKYEDLVGDSDDDTDDIDDDISDDDTDSADDYNDIVGDSGDSDIDDDTIDDELDLSDDEDDIDSSEDSDSSDSDYNTLVVVKDKDTLGGDGNVYDKLAKLGYACTVVANNMKHIHLNASGDKFEEIHSVTDRYYSHFNWIADTAFEIAAESPLIKLDNPTRAKEHVEDIEVETESSYSFNTAVERMTANLSKIIEYAKEARESAGEARTDVQSKLDEELAYLNKEVNFILRRKSFKDETTVSTVITTSESYNYLF